MTARLIDTFGALAILASAGLGTSAPAAAQSASAQATRPTPSVLRAGLAGDWTGSLGYRDYRTNKLNELPVRTTIAAVADQVTQVRTSRFDEGARRPAVWITTVSIDDLATARVTSASFRAGRTTELQTESMTVADYSAPTRWTIVYNQTGSDNDKPAEIRVTETRNGDDLLSVKDVRAVGSDGPWQFRNQTKLRRGRK